MTFRSQGAGQRASKCCESVCTCSRFGSHTGCATCSACVLRAVCVCVLRAVRVCYVQCVCARTCQGDLIGRGGRALFFFNFGILTWDIRVDCRLLLAPNSARTHWTSTHHALKKNEG